MQTVNSELKAVLDDLGISVVARGKGDTLQLMTKRVRDDTRGSPAVAFLCFAILNTGLIIAFWLSFDIALLVRIVLAFNTSLVAGILIYARSKELTDWSSYIIIIMTAIIASTTLHPDDENQIAYIFHQLLLIFFAAGIAAAFRGTLTDSRWQLDHSKIVSAVAAGALVFSWSAKAFYASIGMSKNTSAAEMIVLISAALFATLFDKKTDCSSQNSPTSNSSKFIHVKGRIHGPRREFSIPGVASRRKKLSGRNPSVMCSSRFRIRKQFPK